MKKILMMLLLCLLVNTGYAQEVEFYLWITDKDQIVGYNDGLPEFYDEDINNIFSNYEVTHFAKAFPISGYESLRMVYNVRCDSIGLAEELVAADPVLFPGYEEQVGEVVPLGYSVSDSGLHYDDYLWFIRADEAWMKSRGDSNFVIGVIDTYFDTAHEDMQNKYAQVRRNVMEVSGHSHGTLVAGIMAARTDNALGFPGVGYHCRLDAATLRTGTYNHDSINHVMA